MCGGACVRGALLGKVSFIKAGEAGFCRFCYRTATRLALHRCSRSVTVVCVGFRYVVFVAGTVGLCLALSGKTRSGSARRGQFKRVKAGQNTSAVNRD